MGWWGGIPGPQRRDWELPEMQVPAGKKAAWFHVWGKQVHEVPRAG